MSLRPSAAYLLCGLLALAAIATDAYFGPAEKSLPVPAAARPPAAAPVKTAALAPTFPAQVDSTSKPVAIAEPARPPLVDQLKAIDADYKALANPILDQSAPVIAPDDRARLAFLEQEKLADLGKILSAEELDIYQNQADPAAAPQRR